MVTLTGTAGNDILTGGTDNDDLAGGDGADTIRGNDGNDVLYSGQRIPAGTSPANFHDPAVPLDRGSEVDSLDGGAGDDRIFAGYGDFVDGGSSTGYDGDTLYLSLAGAPSGVTTDFSALDNGGVVSIGGGSITGIESIGYLEGSEYDDVLTLGSRGGFANGPVYGLGGNDRIVLGYYTTAAYGGDGDDYIDATRAGYGPSLFGEAGNDTIIGGSGYENISGGAGDDSIQGNYGFDMIEGGDGNDTLDGGSFNDTIFGGAGNDVIYGAGDYDLLDGGDGDDLLYAQYSPLSSQNALSQSISGDTVFGGAGSDTIYGSTSGDYLSSAQRSPSTISPPSMPDDLGNEKDVIFGGDGNDTIAAGYGDDVDGGSGSDVLRLSLEGAPAGITLDTANLLTGGSSVLGGSNISNVETLAYLRLTRFDDIVNVATSSSLVTVAGGAGNDVITSNGSSVAMSGGSGNDVFVSGAAADIIDGGDGIDTVDYRRSASRVEVTLSDNGVGTGGGGDQLTSIENVIGTAFNDRIVGNSSANLLNGATGMDTLAGGKGDDVYAISDPNAQIIEAVDEGNDVVFTAVSYALTGGAFVETLSFTDQRGLENLNIIGNFYAQQVVGNFGDNVLNGNGGQDTLIGLRGNDTYAIADASAVIIENVGEGQDIVYTSVSYALTGTAEIEALSITTQQGTENLNLIGNGFAQTVVGNFGNNVLNGNGGVDTLIGLRGDDTYVVGDGRTVVVENVGEGFDTVLANASYALAAGSSIEVLSTATQGGTEAYDLTGNGVAQAVIGNNGANVIDGGAGADTLTGLGGADTFRFSTALGNGNVDAITDFGNGNDRISLSSSIFTGMAQGTLSASNFVVGSAAMTADQHIVYNQATGQIFFDADGSGTGTAVLFATVAPNTVLTASMITVA